MNLPMITGHVFRAPPDRPTNDKNACVFQGTCGRPREEHVTRYRYRKTKAEQRPPAALPPAFPTEPVGWSPQGGDHDPSQSQDQQRPHPQP